jgi:lipoprotein-anchoring transpeptidase ErfK/SrfK
MRSILPAMLSATLALAACSDPQPPPAQPAARAQAAAPAPPPAPRQLVEVAAAGPLAVPPPPQDEPPPDGAAPPQGVAPPEAQAVNQASLAGAGSPAEAKRAALIRAEVLLARARFSPGVIDGQEGGNLKSAIAAFQAAKGLPETGKLDEAVWRALTEADPGPVLVDHAITADEVAGPFIAAVPTEYPDMAKLDRLAYTGPIEALAEKFHMDEALLKRLNPGVDFGKAGTHIVVAAPGPETLPAPVAAVEVDKSGRQVRAYGPDGALIAAWPATVGSTERPAPAGTFEVKGVAPNPTYTYDPKRLTYGDKSMGKLTIKPGPNNPVGVVWIDLSIPTYGIHGAPEPRLVGKVASHGCVRLTNWDARQLASGVKKGVKVTFVGVERPSHPGAKLSSASAGPPAPPG